MREVRGFVERAQRRSRRTQRDPHDRRGRDEAAPRHLVTGTEGPAQRGLDRRDVGDHHDDVAGCASHKIVASRAYPRTEGAQRLAARWREIEVSAPCSPTLRTDLGVGDAVPLAIVELDPAIIDLGGCAERRRGVTGAEQWAGHDEVESSPLAFELAAELLVVVIAAELTQGDVPTQVRRRVEAWP